jgi:sigma-B regulation protein RsbU (phosphoserine phosphatase)
LNANYVGFIDANIPLLAQYNREGRSGSLPIYIWRDKQFPQGVERALAYATIPYHGGVYHTPAGFGFVTMTAFASEFHQAATVLGAEIAQEIQQTLVVALASVLLMAALIVMAAWLLARTISHPISHLAKSAAEIGQGRFGQQVDTKSRDEIGQLATTFNTMSRDLQQYVTDLERTTAERERYQRELEIAHDIQQSFLPASCPVVPGVQLAAVNRPAREVGGDFYDFIPLSGGRLGLVVADVSDKGVPAALFMALSRSLVRAYSLGAPTVLDALHDANAFIASDSRSAMFVTLFYAVLDPATMVLSYINAGHNPPILINGTDHQVVLLRARGIALGVIEEIELEERKVQLEQGSLVVLYTDGITEAFNPDHKCYGEARLVEQVRQQVDLPADALVARIIEDVKDFAAGAPQSDDITLMVLKAERGAEGQG